MNIPFAASLPKHLLIIQTCVPDYRLGLFNALEARCSVLKVASGPDYFASTIKDAAMGKAWSVQRSNMFLLKRRFVWLGGHSKLLGASTVAIHEWNPRILSFWRDLLICRWRGIPIVLWGHAWGKDGPGGLMFRLRHWMARRTDGVICYTETQAALTRRKNPGLPVIAAPNACMSKADCGVTGEESLRDSVIYVGRIVEEKKVGLLIEGFAVAGRKYPEFKAKLVIVGDGPERAKLETRTENLGVADRILWLGHQSEIGILRSAYERAFVSVSPGYVGLSLTQSFAFGVPALIARDEPHSPEIEAVREGVNARYFASNDVDNLADNLLVSWQEWRGISAKRHELAAWTAANYSFEKMTERFMKMVRLVS